MAEREKIGVAVLCGGIDGEREISFASGANIMNHFDQDRYEVSRMEVVSASEWHFQAGDAPERVLDVTTDEARQFLQSFDIFFNALHGKYGEDGELQSFLDELGVPYTGSGAAACALTIDKVRSMEYATEHGMTVPEFFCAGSSETASVVRKRVESLHYPIIVKPNDSGSTLGLSLVQKKEELEEALKKAAAVSDDIIIQRYIFGREFTCGVLGNNVDPDLMALPPIEIVIKNQVFDFNDKYFSKDTQELCPAPVDAVTLRRIEEQAMLAHRVFGCDGLSRTDFRMDGTGQLYFLETNASPGLTDGSLCPKEAAAAGIGMPQLLDRIIDLGLSRATKTV